MNRRTKRKIRVGVHTSADERARVIKTASIVIAAMVLVIILTVIWGNALGKKAQGAGDVTVADETTAQIEDGKTTSPIVPGLIIPPSTFNPNSVPVIQADYITLSSYQKIDWGERAITLKSSGVKAVSLILYYGGGTLNYSSKTAQALFYQSADTSKTNLYEAIGVLGVSGIHTSGCFYLNYLKSSTPSLKAINRSYEAALIAEAVDAGFSDILVFGYPATTTGAMEAAKLVSAVYELKNNAVIGFAIPHEAISTADAGGIFSEFAGYAKFLAIDFTTIKTEDMLIAEINKSADYIKSYNIRVVIPSSLEAVSARFEEMGIKNWQVVPE